MGERIGCKLHGVLPATTEAFHCLKELLVTLLRCNSTFDTHRSKKNSGIGKEPHKIPGFLAACEDKCPRETLLALTLLHQEVISAMPLHHDFSGTGPSDPLLGAAMGFELGHGSRGRILEVLRGRKRFLGEISTFLERFTTHHNKRQGK